MITTTSISDARTLAPAWRLSLQALNRSPRTIDSYLDAVRFYCEFADERGMPTDVTAIRREHVEAFIVHLRETRSASTAETRFRGLRRFFAWLEEEGEILESPMVRMKPPKVGITEKHVPETATLEAILAPLRKAKVGQWQDRRDAAIVSLFAGSGLRLSELTNLTVADVDLQRDKGGLAKVTGKGDKFRVVSFRSDVANDMARWMIARARYLAARGRDPEEFAALWIGLKGGAMTGSGIRQMIWKRSEAVGERVHPHQLRHLFASEWLRSGKSESGLMEIGGWASRQMIDTVYARGNRSERAIEEHLRD